VSVNLVDNAAASAGNRILTVGWPEFTTTIATLNPLLYTMASEMSTIWPCYSLMFDRDANGNQIGDLVKSYSLGSDGLTWNFKLVNSAKFYDKNDPAANHPLTGNDVIYTYWLVQNTTDNYLQSYFPVVNGNPIIANMWTGTNVYDLYIQLSAPYAPFLSALGSIPILPEYLWSTESWDWPNFATGANPIAPIIGSGPFYYGLNARPSTGVVELIRSPTWFATEEFGWQLHINKLVIRNELSTDSNYNDYVNGVTDVMELVSPQQYGGSLPGVKFAQSTGFMYEYNLNQMTDDYRAAHPDYAGGSNNQLLLDPVVKKAMAMALDKAGFVSGVLNGLGSPGDSLVPDINAWHYTYPNPVQFDPAQARLDLWNAGWAYDLNGAPILANSTVYPVCKAGGTDPLQFRFWTLNTDPLFALGASLIADWAAEAGIDLKTDYALQNTEFMNSAWSTADYDVWLWDWMFSPVSEVSTDILQVMTTEAIGSWSDIFWSNKSYDDAYYASLTELNPVLRRALTDKMQAIAYESFSCMCVAYRDELYAVSDLGPEHWELYSYGNWEEQWALMPDQNYAWLYMQIEPRDNHAPVISSFQSSYETDTTTAVQFTGAGSDDHFNPVQYRWFFGDGTKTDWMSSASTTHLYANDGYYKAYLAVRENLAGNPDGFVTWQKATVKVIDMSNTAPHDVDFTSSPSDPDSGTLVSLDATAVDDNIDPLSYEWDFGDGSSGIGPSVTHQFTQGAGSYTVTVSVDDGHLGQQARPVNASNLISVTANTPPSCSVPDYTGIIRQTAHTFTITSTDPDSRDSQLYTWDWGDGSDLSVTTSTSAVHSYGVVGIYNLTVYADDLTGLYGHNVSDVGQIQVTRTGTNSRPTIPNAQWVVTPMNPFTGDSVNFSARVNDANGDLCIVTFDFGDGNSATLVQTSPNSTMYADWSYESPGTYLAYCIAFDGTGQRTSAVRAITVQQSDLPPEIEPLPEYIYATTGYDIPFSANATDPDPGDTLTYTWDFGDGTPLQVGQDTDHAYAVPDSIVGYTFTVYVDDGNGTNVSSSGIAMINDVPVLDPLTPMTVMAENLQTFTVTATDEDSLSYTWDFGDGSTPVVGYDNTTDYAFGAVAVPTDYTLTVTVYDGWMDDYGVNHSATQQTTITVTPYDAPPTADAGIDQTVVSGDIVTFDGSLSSDDVGIVEYYWNFTYDGLPVSLNTVNPTFQFITEGSYDVNLTVVDTIGQTSYDNVTITVGPAIIDEPPTADAGVNQTVASGDTVTFDGSLSSDDVGIVQYYWNFTYDGLPVSLTGVSPTFQFITEGVYDVNLTVVDTIGQTSYAHVFITVGPAIPEFPALLVPVTGLMVVVLAAFAMRRRKDLEG